MYDPEYKSNYLKQPMNDHMKSVFVSLNSGDPSIIMTTVIELSSELSMAQETTISPQILEQLVGPLIQCMSMDLTPDIVCNCY